MKSKLASILCLIALITIAACPDDVGYHSVSAWGNPDYNCVRYRTILTDSCTPGLGDQTECYLVKVVLEQWGVRDPSTQQCIQYVDSQHNYQRVNWTRDCSPG